MISRVRENSEVVVIYPDVRDSNGIELSQKILGKRDESMGRWVDWMEDF